MNRCLFTGRISKAPEIKYTQSNLCYLQFNLAVDGGKDANGNRLTDWIPCKAWRQTAEYIHKYVQKGNMLAIVGQFKSRQIQDTNGNTKMVYEVIVDQVENLTPKPQEQKTVDPQYQQPQQPTNFNVDVAEDDIPF